MSERKKYDPDLASLFVQNYGEAYRAARNLSVSIRRTAGIFPLDGSALDTLDDESLERLDAFRIRYAQLQDLIANKLFRSLLKLEEEPAESMLDVLNAMEKRHVITSFEEWKDARELRNTFMHDYPDELELRALALTRAHGVASAILDVLVRLRDHAVSRIGLSAADLPEFHP